MKIRILPPARFDLIDEYWFYEEREAGVGDYFIESVLADIDTLVIYASIHTVYLGKHRMIASKFPVSIFYLIESDEIQIHAILDNRRSPKWTSNRLN